MGEICGWITSNTKHDCMLTSSWTPTQCRTWSNGGNMWLDNIKFCWRPPGLRLNAGHDPMGEICGWSCYYVHPTTTSVMGWWLWGSGNRPQLYNYFVCECSIFGMVWLVDVKTTECVVRALDPYLRWTNKLQTIRSGDTSHCPPILILCNGTTQHSQRPSRALA